MYLTKLQILFPLVGGTLGGKYLLVKKLIAKKGFIDGFKTGINGGKLTEHLPLPFVRAGEPESTVDIGEWN